jgi:hypothetical protein
MIETFKDITGYKGIYQISNFGRVKSLPRSILKINGQTQNRKERILKSGSDKDGYSLVGLCVKGNMKTRKVHQLVAVEFLGHVPDGLNIVVDHINGVKDDNRVENLQLITHRENISKDKKGGSSGYVGVSWNKQVEMWKARITINYKQIIIGHFKTEIEASDAYKKELSKHLEINQLQNKH